MKRNYYFIWPSDFVNKLEGVYLNLNYTFREEGFSQMEAMYRDWVKKMLEIVDLNVNNNHISMATGLERKQEIVKLLNSASIIANLSTKTSEDVKVNLFYKEFERFLNDHDLANPLNASPFYQELLSALSILGQLAFLGVVGHAILDKNSTERDYSTLLKTLQAPYIRAIIKQYKEGIYIYDDKHAVYETAVTVFNENRFDTIKERLIKVYAEFGLKDYIQGRDEITEPSFVMQEAVVSAPSVPEWNQQAEQEHKKEEEEVERDLDMGNEEVVNPDKKK